MQFEGAVIREQRVTFAVVIVKKHIVDSHMQADEAIRAFGGTFPGMPVVLMAQDGRGRPTFYGRRDLSQFMSQVPLGAVRWKRFTLN